MHHAAQQVNSPQTIGWIVVIGVIVALSIITVGLIKDRIKRNRAHKAEMAKLREYNRRDVEMTESLFKTVQEAQNDFR